MERGRERKSPSTPWNPWCRSGDLNPGPTDYESVALPLSYFGIIQREIAGKRKLGKCHAHPWRGVTSHGSQNSIVSVDVQGGEPAQFEHFTRESGTVCSTIPTCRKRRSRSRPSTPQRPGVSTTPPSPCFSAGRSRWHGGEEEDAGAARHRLQFRARPDSPRRRLRGRVLLDNSPRSRAGTPLAHHGRPRRARKRVLTGLVVCQEGAMPQSPGIGGSYKRCHEGRARKLQNICVVGVWVVFRQTLSFFPVAIRAIIMFRMSGKERALLYLSVSHISQYRTGRAGRR